jgi:hypothetical protein
MASGMKFLYYNNQKRDVVRRTISSSSSTNKVASESRIEELKKRFRRSGSLGVPFLPEEEAFELREELNKAKQHEQQTITEVDEEQDLGGENLVTVIVRLSKGARDMMKMLDALPVLFFVFSNEK